MFDARNWLGYLVRAQSPEAFTALRLVSPRRKMAVPWPLRFLMPSRQVRYVGSRELHRDLPKVLDALEDSSARVVLTVHSKPKAVLIGAEAFQALLLRSTPEDRLLALQLEALVKGLEPSSDEDSSSGEIETVKPV